MIGLQEAGGGWGSAGGARGGATGHGGAGELFGGVYVQSVQLSARIPE